MKVKNIDLVNDLEKISHLEDILDSKKEMSLGKTVHKLLKLKHKLVKIKPPY
ncbi:MAG: hypothetical protein IKQ31_03240 [Clostridia bacterium]|nr:hypothetical protein [Clostridia bacterium]